MRAMPLAFPDDRCAWGFEMQYMLGDHLLVAPVLQPGGWVTLYLPAGDWFDFYSGERVAGGRVINLKVSLSRLPVYVREGAILAEGPAVQHTGEITAANRIAKIRVFGRPLQTALAHENDICLTHHSGKAVLEFAADIPVEVFGVESRQSDGLLEV